MSTTISTIDQHCIVCICVCVCINLYYYVYIVYTLYILYAFPSIQWQRANTGKLLASLTPFRPLNFEFEFQLYEWLFTPRFATRLKILAILLVTPTPVQFMQALMYHIWCLALYFYSAQFQSGATTSFKITFIIGVHSHNIVDDSMQFCRKENKGRL